MPTARCQCGATMAVATCWSCWLCWRCRRIITREIAECDDDDAA